MTPNDSTRLEAAETSEIHLWDPKRKTVGDISLFLSMSKEPEDSDEEPEDGDVESDNGIMSDYRGPYKGLTPLWESVLNQSYPLLKILGQCLVRSFVTSAQTNSNMSIRLICMMRFLSNGSFTAHFTSLSLATLY